MLDFLKSRRSVLARNMAEPGPSAAMLREFLTAAARVPDHGKLAPWRFVVLEGQSRIALGRVAAKALDDVVDDADDAVLHQFERAPCVVAVLAAPVAHPKIPRAEMIYSAGAACMNLLIAAQAQGFAAQWLTGAAAYAPQVIQALGGTEGDEIAGFIYIGTATERPSDRVRPKLDDIVQYGLSQ